jgi:anti-sigma regulatory factor (Ser/Thr protein kinase)
VNVVVGGDGLPPLPALAARERMTYVGLDGEELRRVLAGGADAAMVVSPSPDRGDECQALAFGLIGRDEQDVVTIAHPSTHPTVADLLRWSRHGYGLRGAAGGDVSLPLAIGGVSPAHARRAAIEYVGGTLGPTTSDVAALVVSELVSNALQHAGDGTLQLQMFDCGVHVAVLDHDPRRWPSMRPHAPLGDAGRGLGIVAALSATWGVSAAADTKAVWCEVT